MPRRRGSAAMRALPWCVALACLAFTAAAAHPLAGTYLGTSSAGAVRLQLADGPFGLTGFLEIGSDRVDVIAWVFNPDGSVTGSFDDPERDGGFEAQRDGTQLTLRVYEPGGPLATPDDPIVTLVLRYAPEAPRELARGRHAILHAADLEAFVDAVEFALERLGWDGRFEGHVRDDIVAAMPELFPLLSRLEQLVVADAERMWRRVSGAWSTASEAERRTFVLGIVTMAYGEANVHAWVGLDGERGEAGALDPDVACDDIEACLRRFVDGATWDAAAAAQGCWAIAGCVAYDARDGRFVVTGDD